MYVNDFAPVPIRDAAIGRLRRNSTEFPGIDSLVSAVQGMKVAPPTSAQVARIYAALNGMNLGRSRNLSNNGIQPMPYDLNSTAPVYRTLPARKTYTNDTLQLLLNKLGQGL